MATPPVKTELADTYPNPSNAVFRTGIGKLWETLFGTGGLLGTTGNAAEARNALGIGPTISFRNRLRNNRFNVNQRAVSGTVVLGSGAYGHDGWKAGAAGCTYTFSGGVLTITAGSLSQVIEDVDIEGGTYCLSWTGTSTGRLNNSGAYAASGLTGSLAGLTSAYVEFSTGTLSSVQLEPGTVATPVEGRPYALEMALCQRYYQTSYLGAAPGTPSATGRLIQTVVSTGVGDWSNPVYLAGAMRTAPTVTIYNPSTGAVGTLRDEGSGAAYAGSAASGIGPQYFRVINTVTVGAAPRAISFHYAASADL